ncbi:MAG: acetyl-CoA C-acyltransferase [Actinobacteria bacterium]|nr:acetyl-CoA C-acyltransferase [Actinomycetota bacterium]MEC7811106.1 acetyl-CoA C-acetyltransferase [Actinomycetota bacterium]MED5276463.1 acetyl-CoA C-acetyltransferase [Actinomycetota bacterium]|tara:strand:- start:3512 stop:4690 length:1179 start_codon:yes stop_codon:yes gene_type:complete
MSRIVILAGVRTPIGRLQGGLKSVSATDLGAIAIKESCQKARIEPSQIDFSYLGNVISAGIGQVPARRAAVDAGIPMTSPSTLLNRACLSGMHSIHLAGQMLRLKEAEIIIAGGMESMTNSPYMLPGARSGLRFGDGKLIDSMLFDGLTCTIENCSMGEATDRFAQELGISREDQDIFAAQSHQRAAKAQKDGLFDEEICSVDIPQRNGDTLTVKDDEGIRQDADLDSMSRLSPAFTKDGTITAGNASQISDGGAAMVVTTLEKAEQLGVEPVAEIIAHGQVAGPDTSLLHQPSNAINAALDSVEMKVNDLDLFEINEAFAAVALASMKDLGVSDEIVNVNGGAIALGHPIGMSGTRVVLTLVHELRRQGGGMGAASLCGGGGQGEALILKV